MSTTVTDAPTLSVADRCDGCGAQAYVHVTLIGGGELLFCAHHWGRHSDALAAKVAQLRDETERLNEVAAAPDS